MSGQSCVLRFPGLANRICLIGSLVVPVLEVLIYSSLLSSGILSAHSGETTIGLGRLAVEDLVEGSIACDILMFQTRGSHGVEKE